MTLYDTLDTRIDMAMRDLTAEELEIVFREYEAGASPEEIAEEYGFDETLVVNYPRMNSWA